MKFFVIFAFLLCHAGRAQEYLPASEWDGKKDTVYFFTLMWSGFKNQFTTKNNLYYLPPAVGAHWYAFEHDDRIAALTISKELKKPVDIIGNMGVAMNFPILSGGLYYYGRKNKNQHVTQFAFEYAATLYMVLAESGFISYIHVHDRPKTDGLSFWESEFRGKSSYPSGHMVPYAALFFKTLQFYGPYWAILPAVLTYFGSLQRLQDGRHYLSDVVGGFFLAAFASEGVRATTGYQHNHPCYKWLFEHDARLAVLRYRGKIGPRLVWNF